MSECIIQLPTMNIVLGTYEQLDVSLLPPLWLAYLADPSDSGEPFSINNLLVA